MLVRALLLAALLIPAAATAQTFEEALAAAYRSHPRLLAERQRVIEADETWFQARAQGRLSAGIDLQVAPTFVRIPNDAFGPVVVDPGAPPVELDGTSIEYLTTRQGGVQVIQPIYQGGRVGALKDQAKAGVLAARALLEGTEQDVLVAAADAYATLRRAEEAARIRRNNVSVILRQREAADARFEVGVGTRTDTAQAEARVAQARIGLARAEADLAAARAAFESAVGVPPSGLRPVPRFAIPKTASEAVPVARAANPTLAAAAFGVEAAEANIDVARSGNKPQISLNGQLGFIREGLGGLQSAETLSVTGQLTVPFASGGAVKSRVRQAKAARNRARFELRDAERQVVEAVRQLYAQLEAANTTIAAARTAVTSAETAFEGVVLEQEVGTRTSLDVLDAEQEVLDARLAVVDAELARDRATFQLLALLGAFDADSLRLPVDTYLADAHFREIKDDGYARVARNPVVETVDDARDWAVDIIGPPMERPDQLPD